MNTFGERLRLTTYGESHGKGIGGVLDGLPSGIKIDREWLQTFLNYRRPGSSSFVSPRNESDLVEILSGVDTQDYTTGAPIGLYIPNQDVRSEDYRSLSQAYRPGHADYTYHLKYGLPPQAGGGRASARETAIRCAAAGLLLPWLSREGITIHPYMQQVGSVQLPQQAVPHLDLTAWDSCYQYSMRCPHTEWNAAMQQELLEAQREGDSVGGVIACMIRGVPAGLGSPLYHKLSAQLAYAMFSIPAVKGFAIGDGYALASQRGSASNDAMQVDASGNISFATNHSGGITGGISTGQEIFFTVACKPTATIAIPQTSCTTSGKATILEGKGRHDPCLALRATTVIHAMASLVIADALLARQDEISAVNR